MEDPSPRAMQIMRELTKTAYRTSDVLSWHDQRGTLYHLEVIINMVVPMTQPDPNLGKEFAGFYSHRLFLHLYDENAVFEHRLRFDQAPLDAEYFNRRRTRRWEGLK
ncbi:MAG: hypothetical protein EOP83_05165 [Verrucomicrobiaceae bacterium]|nr:MAG: hypothetical protein EOP83_05165 [Verrucomicrobiaceae bacterium]